MEKITSGFLWELIWIVWGKPLDKGMYSNKQQSTANKINKKIN